MRPNRFIWYGTSKVFDSLSLTFRETEHGVFCAHHYRYSPAISTFLVEVTDATWHKAGFAGMDEAATIRHCEQDWRRFGWSADTFRQVHWRQFPAVTTGTELGNVVLMGDALRTADFWIGSGTRLAMEDAIALWKALRDTGTLREALALYQERRLPPMKKILDAADAGIRCVHDEEQIDLPVTGGFRLQL